MSLQNHMLLFYCGVIQMLFYDSFFFFLHFGKVQDIHQKCVLDFGCTISLTLQLNKQAAIPCQCLQVSQLQISMFIQSSAQYVIVQTSCNFGSERSSFFFSQGSTFLWVQSRLQIPGETRCLPLSGHTSSLFRLLNSITLCLGESNYRGERLQAELWFAQWGKGSL